MHLVGPLVSGIIGAENGTAEIYDRAGAQRIAWYEGNGGFEAQNQQSTSTDVSLDEYGSAIVYVSQLAKIVVKDSDGTIVRTFVAGSYDANVEVRSSAFTGVDYSSGASAAGNPTTLEKVLDAALTSFGSTDWKVDDNGTPSYIKDIITAVSGFLVSVKSYGAKGDSTEDDTTAIQECLNDASTSGKVVYFPPGTYRVDSVLTLPAGVHMWGAGPEKSIVQINDGTGTLFQCTGAGSSFQVIRGLAFGAAQTNTRRLFLLAAAALLSFENCLFGDDNTQSASTYGLFHVGGAVAPQVSFDSCEFYIMDGFAGQIFTDGTFTGTHLIRLRGCTMTLAGDYAGASPMFEALHLQAISNYFNIAADTVSSDAILGLNAAGTLIAIGNRVGATSGNIAFITGNGGAVVQEAGNLVNSTANWYLSVSAMGAGTSLAGRKNRSAVVSQSGGGTLDIGTEVGECDTILVTITDGTAFSIQAASALFEGQEFDLMLENDAGGATGAITWITTSFAGLNAVSSSLVPPTSLASVGDMVTIHWRAFTGPDGLRFYPVGSTLVAT
jgi:Pectate lyase superfamily protein